MSPETKIWWELGRALRISILELSEYEERWFVSQERQTLEIMYNWQRDKREEQATIKCLLEACDKVNLGGDKSIRVLF